jgi:hypothetical protein
LQLKCGDLLSTVAFKCNLRHYNKGQVVVGLVRDVLTALGMESTLRVFEPVGSD